jgi:hypothetical protein
MDSGNRQEFSTGAVRDIQEGKGRCDLLPLDVVARCYAMKFPDDQDCAVFHDILKFTETKDTEHLFGALSDFGAYNSWADMFLEVSKHFEEGAKKYGEYNWQKGIPVHCYVNSAVRHYFKWLRGDMDEPHDRAFVWNIMCLIWTVEHGKGDANEIQIDN